MQPAWRTEANIDIGETVISARAGRRENGSRDSTPTAYFRVVRRNPKCAGKST